LPLLDKLNVSIHASRAGRDLAAGVYPYYIGRFNPRVPRGTRPPASSSRRS